MIAGKNTLLLIEDDPDDAEMILYSLTKLNQYNFFHIDDGAEALRFLFSSGNPQPLLILLDLKMPKVDGIEILKRLKEDPEKKHIPVVALISSKDGRRYVESFEVKADGYLQKPVECQAFLSILAEIGISQMSVGKNIHFKN